MNDGIFKTIILHLVLPHIEEEHAGHWLHHSTFCTSRWGRKRLECYTYPADISTQADTPVTDERAWARCTTLQDSVQQGRLTMADEAPAASAEVPPLSYVGDLEAGSLLRVRMPQPMGIVPSWNDFYFRIQERRHGCLICEPTFPPHDGMPTMKAWREGERAETNDSLQRIFRALSPIIRQMGSVTAPADKPASGSHSGSKDVAPTIRYVVSFVQKKWTQEDAPVSRQAIYDALSVRYGLEHDIADTIIRGATRRGFIAEAPTGFFRPEVPAEEPPIADMSVVPDALQHDKKLLQPPPHMLWQNHLPVPLGQLQQLIAPMLKHLKPVDFEGPTAPPLEGLLTSSERDVLDRLVDGYRYQGKHIYGLGDRVALVQPVVLFFYLGRYLCRIGWAGVEPDTLEVHPHVYLLTRMISEVVLHPRPARVLARLNADQHLTLAEWRAKKDREVRMRRKREKQFPGAPPAAYPALFGPPALQKGKEPGKTTPTADGPIFEGEFPEDDGASEVEVPDEALDEPSLPVTSEADEESAEDDLTTFDEYKLDEEYPTPPTLSRIPPEGNLHSLREYLRGMVSGPVLDAVSVATDVYKRLRTAKEGEPHEHLKVLCRTAEALINAQLSEESGAIQLGAKELEVVRSLLTREMEEGVPLRYQLYLDCTAQHTLPAHLVVSWNRLLGSEEEDDLIIEDFDDLGDLDDLDLGDEDDYTTFGSDDGVHL